MIPSFDMEILIPVDNSFKDTDMYKFKKEITLTNCIKINYRGNPNNFQNSIITLQQYIQENKLVPISSLYTVNIKDIATKEDIENFEADAYVSIILNIL